MQPDELKKLWADERNWGDGWLGCYFCKDDPRLIVPKRRYFGGTFNMAHRLAVPLMTAIIVFLIFLSLLGFLSLAARRFF